MLGGETPAWRLTISCVCIGAKASKYERVEARAYVCFNHTLTWEDVAAIFQFPNIFVLSIFDSKASFQVMAKSQPFGFQPRLSRYPFTSLSDELSYSLYSEESWRARRQFGTVYWDVLNQLRDCRFAN